MNKTFDINDKIYDTQDFSNQSYIESHDIESMQVYTVDSYENNDDGIRVYELMDSVGHKRFITEEEANIWDLIQNVDIDDLEVDNFNTTE